MATTTGAAPMRNSTHTRFYYSGVLYGRMQAMNDWFYIRHRIEDLSDEHLNQMRWFMGLPPLTAEEAKRLRGFCRWMRSCFAPDPDPPPSEHKQLRS
jgi:hypothetical protein